MTLALVFWILMLLWLASMLWWYWPMTRGGTVTFTPSDGFLFVLLLILGWGIFGSPIR